MSKLSGKVAIVTGGASGMGRATVMRFLAEGAKVMVADLNDANGAETIAVAKAQGHADAIAFRRCDVAKEADVAQLVAETVKRFGRLDIAYLNAGVGGAFGPIAETSTEDWDYTFAVLVRSVFLGMKHASLAMRKLGNGGVILVTASIAGMVGGAGPHAYSAAKAAVINLTRAVAIELAPAHIRVNCICPGGINTPLIHRGSPEAMGQLLDRAQPWPEHGRPEDIAAAALYLASDDARFVTGAALVVDGGLTCVGGNTLRGQAGGAMAMQVVGLDRGSTGQPSTIRGIE